MGNSVEIDEREWMKNNEHEYLCNCVNGIIEDDNFKMTPTVVDGEGVCIYCGYYAKCVKKRGH